ncbi:MAG: hypothetical protein PHR92_16180 [Lachnospiraceae bacterium]|nr:hypothetical protein [Lachnospiraceae bacterium]
MKKKLLLSFFISIFLVSTSYADELKFDSSFSDSAANELSNSLYSVLDSIGAVDIDKCRIVEGTGNDKNVKILIDIDDKQILARCYLSKNGWVCSSIVDPEDEHITYYTTSTDKYAYEIIDLFTGEYIIEGKAKEVIDAIPDNNTWFTIDDFYFYNGDRNKKIAPDGKVETFLQLSDYENLTTNRLAAIGDYAVDVLEEYDLDYASIFIYAKDKDNENIANDYYSKIENMTAEELLNFIPAIDTTKVRFYMQFDVGYFCGHIIPDLKDNNVFCWDRYSIGFSIKDAKIEDVSISHTKK